MKKEYQKYWLCGIIGAVCFGIGDWLLGYVDPGIVNESFSVIKAGHGADYDLFKITITLLFGAIGVPFLMLGCVKMADLIMEEKKKKTFRFWMALLPVGWLIIHFTVSVFIYAYSWSMQNGMSETAEKLAADIEHASTLKGAWRKRIGSSGRSLCQSTHSRRRLRRRRA